MYTSIFFSSILCPKGILLIYRRFLGDIVISYDRVISQAHEFNHSVRREFAFLVAHSMLHLFGYDHMEEEEREQMEARQREILNGLSILR